MRIYKNKKFFIFLILLGLIIRVLALFTKGMEDVDVMVNWGNSIEQNGWNKGYKAIYFPTSHLIFFIIVKIAKLVPLDVFTIFAIFRFSIEVLILLALLFFLKYKILNQLTVVFIWLNPLFLVLSLSGYTDNFSILFFLIVILTLNIFAQSKNKFYLFLSSLSLSLFIFLKPQTLVLSVFLILFSFIFIIFTKKLKLNYIEILIFIIPLIMIALFYSNLLSSEKKLDCSGNLGPITISSLNNPSLVEWNICIEKELVGNKYPKTGPEICISENYEAFAPNGSAGFCIRKYEYFYPRYVDDYFSTGFEILKNQVLNGTAEHMPSYSANMPNIWHIYVINSSIYESSKEVWFFKATNSFNKLILYANLLIILILTIILLYINKKIINNWLKLFIFSGFFITFNIPLFSTLAHENHLALGVLFAILLTYILRDVNFKLNNLLVLILSTLLAINISNLYLLPLWLNSDFVFLKWLHFIFNSVFNILTINIISYLVTATSFLLIISFFNTSLKINKISKLD